MSPDFQVEVAAWCEFLRQSAGKIRGCGTENATPHCTQTTFPLCRFQPVGQGLALACVFSIVIPKGTETDRLQCKILTAPFSPVTWKLHYSPLFSGSNSSSSSGSTSGSFFMHWLQMKILRRKLSWVGLLSQKRQSAKYCYRGNTTGYACLFHNPGSTQQFPYRNGITVNLSKLVCLFQWPGQDAQEEREHPPPPLWQHTWPAVQYSPMLTKGFLPKTYPVSCL